MGRKKKPGFRNMKMMSSRVELDDYERFEYLAKRRDRKNLQDLMNLFVTEYISGALYLSGSGFGVRSDLSGSGFDL